MTPHRCDHGCVCPIHGTQLWYHAGSDTHACQDPECPNANGVRQWGEQPWDTPTGDHLGEAFERANKHWRDTHQENRR